MRGYTSSIVNFVVTVKSTLYILLQLPLVPCGITVLVMEFASSYCIRYFK